MLDYIFTVEEGTLVDEQTIIDCTWLLITLVENYTFSNLAALIVELKQSIHAGRCHHLRTILQEQDFHALSLPCKVLAST